MTDAPLPPLAFFTLPTGERMAHRHLSGEGPTIVFLPGYMSDMEGGKATAVMADAMQKGRACLLLDYTGCGQSDGDFADGSLSRWCREVVALVEHLGVAPVLLVGSSMGGWLMLLIAEALQKKHGADAVAALIGIAAAPDFTDWGFDEEQKRALSSGETIYEANPYGPEPTPTHARFWQDGESRLMLESPVPLRAKVRLLHGQRDADVPWEISLQLADMLESDDVRVTLVKDGDHRLSRESDIALLLATLDEVLG